MPQFTKGKWYAGMEDKYGPYVYDRTWLALCSWPFLMSLSTYLRTACTKRKTDGILRKNNSEKEND